MEAFYLVDSEIFNLPNSTALIYNFLSKVDNVLTEESHYGIKNIARLCHVSKSTVVRAVRILRHKGLLEIRPRYDHGRQTSNEYRLIKNPQLKLDLKDQPKQDPPSRPRLFPCKLSTFPRKLSANAIKVYTYLSFRADKNGTCEPSKKEIAADCRISVSTVGRAIKALKESSLIEIFPQTRLDMFGNNGTSVNQYVLKNPEQGKPSEGGADTAESGNPASDMEQPHVSTETPEKPAEVTGEALQEGMPLTLEKTLPVPHRPIFRSFRLPPFQIHFFDRFDDTLPHFISDTPRTRSRKKATVNLREKSLFPNLALRLRNFASKLQGREISMQRQNENSISR